MIWTPAYGKVTELILITNNKARKLIFMTGCYFLVLGLFVFAAVYNDVMFTPSDDRLVGLWEHQQEDLGMILSGTSIIFFWYKVRRRLRK